MSAEGNMFPPPLNGYCPPDDLEVVPSPKRPQSIQDIGHYYQESNQFNFEEAPTTSESNDANLMKRMSSFTLKSIPSFRLKAHSQSSQEQENVLKLIEACKNKDFAAVTSLLKITEVDVNSKDPESLRTVLHYATEYTWPDIVTLLIEKNVKINALDKYNRTALHIACENEDRKAIIGMLVQHGADVTLKTGEDQATPFLLACRYSSPRGILFLLEKGSTKEECDKEDRNAMHYACLGGNFEIVKFFVDHNFFKLTDRDKNKKTYLHNACEVNHHGTYDIVKYLLMKKPDMLFDTFGTRITSVFLHACQYSSLEIVQYLLTKGCSWQNTDNDESTALHYACAGGNLDVVKFILEQNVFNLNVKDRWGQTPLYFACTKTNNIDLINHLIDSNAQIEQICKDGYTIMNFITEQLLDLKHTKARFQQQLLSSMNPNYRASGQKQPPPSPTIKNGMNLRKDSLLAKQRKQWEDYVLREKKLTYVACKAIRQIQLPQEKGHERVFIDLVACHSLPVLALAIMKYLPYLPSSVTMLNTQLNIAPDEQHTETVLFTIFRNYLVPPYRDEMLSAGIDISSSPGEHIAKQYMTVFHILQCIHGLQSAMRTHPTERVEMKEMISRFESMLSEILVSNIFYEQPQHFLKMLTHCGDVFPTTQGSEYSNWNTILIHQFDDHEEVEKWEALKNPHSILQYCLKHQIMVFFDKPQIFPWMRSIFFSVPKMSHMDTKNYIAYSFYSWSFSLVYDNTPNEKRKEYYGDTYGDLKLARKYYYHLIKYTHSLPSNPGILLLTEFLVKVILIWLVAMVVIQEYGMIFHTDYSKYYDAEVAPTQHRSIQEYSDYEVALAVFGGSNFLYEVGKLNDAKGNTWGKKIQHYLQFFTIWHLLEMISLALGVAWFLLRFVAMGNHEFPAARVVLSVSVIPLTFGLLRYLSFYKPLGILIFIMRFLLHEFSTYILFYFISLFAFGMTLYSLFYSNLTHVNGEYVNHDSSTMGLQLLTLFTNTIGNIDFYAFQTNNESVNVLGIVLTIAFVVLTYILLTYLLIAQITNSYDNVKRKAEQHWYYSFAQMISQYTIFEERQVFSILPPPFNVFVIFFAPLHYLILYLFGFSIGTTFANIAYSYFYGTWFRLFHNLFHWYNIWSFHIPTMFQDHNYSLLRKVLFTITHTLAVLALLFLEIIFLPLYSIGWEIFYSLHSKVNQTTLVDKYVNENNDFRVRQSSSARYSSPSSSGKIINHSTKKSSLYLASARGKIGYVYLSFVEQSSKDEHVLQWKRAISRHAENGEKFGVDESMNGLGVGGGEGGGSPIITTGVEKSPPLHTDLASTGETSHVNSNSLQNLFIEIDSSKGKAPFADSTTAHMNNNNTAVSYDINDFIPDHPQSTRSQTNLLANQTKSNSFNINGTMIAVGKSTSTFNFDIPELPPIRETGSVTGSVLLTPSKQHHHNRHASTSSMSIRLEDSLFSELDIQRILRPLKSNVKSSIYAKELVFLQNNITQETQQSKEDVIQGMDTLVKQQESFQQSFQHEYQKLQTSMNEHFLKVAKMNDLDSMKKMLKTIKTDTDTKFQEISHNLIHHTEEFLEPLQQSTAVMENKLIALQTNHFHVLQEVHAIRMLVQDEMKRELIKLQGENHNTMITGMTALEQKIETQLHTTITDLQESIHAHETTTTTNLTIMKEEMTTLKGQVNSLETKVVTMEHTLQDIKGILESLVRQNPWSPRKLSVTAAASSGAGGGAGAGGTVGVAAVGGGSSNGTSSVSGTLSTTSSVRFS